MTKKFTCIALFLLAFTASFAQSSLNDYKYVIVPNKYEFLNTADEHRLNWLTKSLFQSLKFEAIMNEDALPQDLKSNGCLALQADVLDGSKMIKTKLKIQLKNCDGEIVYTSEHGVSKEKNYKKAYHEALRMAFKFLEAENYSYKPNVEVLVKEKVSNQEKVQEIEKLKEEIKELKAVKIAKIEKTTNAETVIIPIDKKEQIVTKPNDKGQPENKKPTVKNITLTAELIPESKFSYLIKNNNRDIVYTLLFSGKEDFYMVKGVDALVYKINNNWVIAQYIEKELQVKSLDIKF